MGLATLRMPLLPTEAPPDRREMVLMAGRASYMMATRNTAAAEKAFQALVARYPETPNVHYAYGVFLLQEQPDKAIEEFKRELELQPEHPWSLMQIAYEYLKRGDAQAALPWAKQAVAAAPNAFPARKALGQALLDTGDVDGAIRELRGRHQARAGEPGPALHARARLSARRPPGGRRARARRVHAARSPGAHAAERRAVGGGKMTVIATCRSALPFSVVLAIRWQGRRSNSTAPPAPQRAAGTRQRRRPRRARRRRRPRPARAAGPRPDAGRLRGARGRRAAEDRIVHAGLRERASAGGGGARAPPRSRARPARARAHAAAVDNGPVVTALVFDRLTPEAAASGRAGGAGLPRHQGRDAELHRHLRRRPGADAVRAVHAQRATRCARR